jgi:GAF domain-containing protein
LTVEPAAVDELAAVFARVSGLLLTEQTVDTALHAVTALAVDTISGSAGSGITPMNSRGERVTSAATDPMVEELDALQYEVDDGPCLTAWRDRLVVRSGSLDIEARWPSWSPLAAAMGMRSVLSAPLVDDGRGIGAMKVYSTVPDAFGEKEEDLLHRFAVQAAIFVSNVVATQVAENVSDSLRDTLRTRDLVATARGIVMARRGLDVEAANRYLMTESHRSSVVIRELAEAIVASPGEA